MSTSDTKWMFVVRPAYATHGAFAADMMQQVVPRLVACQPTKAKLTLTEQAPPKRTLFGFRKEPVAVFCVWGEDPQRYQEAIVGAAERGLRSSTYRVEESTPVAYDRSWPDGSPTPSPILLTMLHKKQGLSHDEYIERWHGGHTPLSLKIHPLWYYQRNVILEQRVDDAGRCDGIVEEACPDRSSLLNPTKFFGGPIRMVPNMLRVAADIKGFLNMSKIEVYFATEYHLAVSG